MLRAVAVCLALIVVGLSSPNLAFSVEPAPPQTAQAKVYELRTYYVLPGRMPAMLKRFKEHTTALFEKHGMQNIGYWTPQGKDADAKLIYLVAHDSKAAADKSWKAFVEDPVWIKARDESEKDGKIVEKVERVYLDSTDFSKLK